MHKLAVLSLKNRALIALITVVVALFGGLAMTSLKQELAPSVQFPQLVVFTAYPGAAPEVVNNDLSTPIETAIQGVPGLESTATTSSTNSSLVTATFKYGTDLATAEQKIGQAINRIKSTLPDNTDPQVISASIDDLPVIQIAATGKYTITELADALRREAVPDLTNVEGVRDASLVGAPTQRITITPDLAQLAAAGVSSSAISDTLKQNGVLLPAGEITEANKTYSVQAGTQLGSVADIAALPLVGATPSPEGVVHTIGSVAKVELGQDPQTSISRVDGEPAVTIAITKTPDANTVAVSQAVRDLIPDVEKKLGTDVKLSVVFDQAPYIEQSIESLATEGLLGLVFAVLVILLFLLDVRATLVTAISIPTSVLITFIGLQATGYTLNILTLGALTIAIGRVVDDSIVVIENIKRHLQLSPDQTPAARLGAIGVAVREVAGAITASTITTVAVFLPLAFVGEMTGELFRPFALTVTIALAASLLVALTIVPVLAFWFLRVKKDKPAKEVKTAPEPARAPLAIEAAPASPAEATAATASASESEPESAAAAPSASAAASASAEDPAGSEHAPASDAGVDSATTEIAVVQETAESGTPVPAATDAELAPAATDAEPAPAATEAEPASAATDVPENESASAEPIAASLAAAGDETANTPASTEAAAQTAHTPHVPHAAHAAHAAHVGADGVALEPSLTTTATREQDAEPETGSIPVVPGAPRTRRARRAASGEGIEPDELDNPSWLQRGYLPIISWTVKHSVTTLLLALLVLGGTGFLAQFMKLSFLGSSGQNTLNISQTLEQGASLQTQDTAASTVEKKLREIKGIDTVQVSIGSSGSALSDAFSGGGSGNISYSITTDANADQDALQATVRKELDKLKGVGTLKLAASSGFGASNVIKIDVQASSAKALAEATKTLHDKAAKLDGAAEVDDTISEARPFIQVKVDRDAAAKVGLSEVALGGIVAQAMRPGQIGQIALDETTVKIYLASENPPQTLAEVQGLTIPTLGGPQRLDALANVSVVDGPATITTIRGDRSASVNITPAGEDIGGLSSQVTKLLKDTKLPDGVTAAIGGVASDQSTAFSQLGLAMLAAILIVYIVMVATFRSLRQPLLLLVSVPFAATGAIGLQVATGVPLGVPSLIGVLMLVGIVVTNAIVMIDLVNQYRERGLSVPEAVKHGAARRLRPILMTALATIFALIPMALGITGHGGFISQPLAIVVIGGLLSSTVLTLIVLPSLYNLVEGAKDRRAEKRAAKAAAKAAADSGIPNVAQTDSEAARSGSGPAQTGRNG
ncbi:efflux RND transporter permease subunit [Mycetocola saprophilus]|uniref:efflux RND transporter permease subunit n=1 Tax=Mycetocola saprophilus TaxID=76636 RepID=UPI00068FAAD2|nr:efflux RND transporter permease subunit [Mycetocola saprophilus]